MIAPATPASRWLGRRYLFRIKSFRIPTYTALLYLGCMAGISMGARLAARAGLDPPRFAIAATLLLIPALIGARFWFVLQHLSGFRRNPRRIWSRADGGSALYGGLVLSVAASIPALRFASLPFREFWDAAGVTMLVGMVVTRIGCLINGCCAGRPTTSPLGLWLPDIRGEWRKRFPTPLLEAAWAAAVLLWVLTSPAVLPSGARFLRALAAYAAGRLLLELTRDSTAEGGLGINFLFSAALFLAAGFALLFG